MSACRTALILGCEFACKDAVEVLLKSGADITAVDNFGYDSLYYAQQSKNKDLLDFIKRCQDDAKGKVTSLSAGLRSRIDSWIASGSFDDFRKVIAQKWYLMVFIIATSAYILSLLYKSLKGNGRCHQITVSSTV